MYSNGYLLDYTILNVAWQKLLLQCLCYFVLFNSMLMQGWIAISYFSAALKHLFSDI